MSGSAPKKLPDGLEQGRERRAQHAARVRVHAQEQETAPASLQAPRRKVTLN